MSCGKSKARLLVQEAGFVFASKCAQINHQEQCQ